MICRLDYEDGETLTVLSCKHTYHPECINNWLKINRVPRFEHFAILPFSDNQFLLRIVILMFSISLVGARAAFSRIERVLQD